MISRAKVPIIYEAILNSGVLVGKDGDGLRDRQIWTAVARVFNPRDYKDYVSLILESCGGTLAGDAFA